MQNLYSAWRALVADVVRRGRDAGAFAPRLAPGHVAVLTIALVDGVGIPLALGDPQITADGAADGAVAGVLTRAARRAARDRRSRLARLARGRDHIFPVGHTTPA